MPPLINGLVVSPSITKWGNCLPEFLLVIEVLEIHELKNFIKGLKIYFMYEFQFMLFYPRFIRIINMFRSCKSFICAILQDVSSSLRLLIWLAFPFSDFISFVICCLIVCCKYTIITIATQILRIHLITLRCSQN